MKMYGFKATYWTEYMAIDAGDATTAGIVVAESYPDAVSKIEHRLENLVDLTIAEVNYDDFVFFEVEQIPAVRKFFEVNDDEEVVPFQ